MREDCAKSYILEYAPYTVFPKFIFNYYGAKDDRVAIILTLLIDLDASDESIRLSADPAYFMCTDNYIQSIRKYDTHTIKSILNKLEEDGFIKVQVVKLPAGNRRFIRVDKNKIKQVNCDYLQIKKEPVQPATILMRDLKAQNRNFSNTIQE